MRRSEIPRGGLELLLRGEGYGVFPAAETVEIIRPRKAGGASIL